MLRRLTLAAFAAALGSCATHRAEDAVTVVEALDMPAEVAAALLSEALCEELHALPSQGAGGSPATERDGTFSLTLDLNRRGRWLAVADDQLTLERVAAHGEAVVRRAPRSVDAARDGFGRARVDRAELSIRADQQGVEVRLLARPALRAKLAARIRVALELAEDPWRGGAGATAPQLAAWRLGALLRRADAAPDDVARATLLRRAARSPHATAQVFERLGDLQAVAGDAPAATNNLRRAALCTRDPLARARLARKAAVAAAQVEQPGSQRRRALGELTAGRLDAAEARLHTARRAAPEPALDYQLLSAVHRCRGDELAALAAELLAREHDVALHAAPAAPMAEARPQASIRAPLDLLPLAEWPGAASVRASRELYGPIRAAASTSQELQRR